MKLSTSEARLPPMTEKAFMGQVVGLAKMLGWKVYHTYRSTRSEPGFPDLCLVGGRDGRRLIFAELKREFKHPTPAQVEWLKALDVCEHVEVYIWRPPDLQSIADILR